MRINKLSSAITLFLLLIGLTGIHAQGDTVSVGVPVSGRLLLEYDGQASILLVDTASGAVQNLVDEGPIVRNSLFSPSENQITYFSNIDNRRQNRQNVILDIATGDRQIVTALGSREIPTVPRRWSASENAIFYYIRNVGPQLPHSYRFELLDLDTNSLTSLREFIRYEILSGFELPFNVPGLALEDIYHVAPNPIYDPWVALMINGINTAVDPDLSGDTSDEANVADVILWNYQTQQMFSVANTLGQELALSDFVQWSPDGTKLSVIAEETGITILQFVPTDSNVVLEVENSAIGGIPLMWLGVEDILISTMPSGNGDTIYLLGQFVGNQWRSTEFFRLPYQDFPATSVMLADWRLTADPEEQRQLSCLFDEGLPARLVVTGRGQVIFKDGTPSRLRSAPGTDSEVLTQMAEGTAFTVIGEPYCADDYRWWQIQLDDGTVGYAAETHMIADGSEYFLEPLEITATEIPSLD